MITDLNFKICLINNIDEYWFNHPIGHHFGKFWQVRNLRLPFHFIVYTVRIWDQVSNPMNFYDIRSITASVNLFQIFAEYIFCPMFTLNITRCHLILYVYYIPSNQRMVLSSWWRYQMETISALLAICAGNSPVPGEFPAQRPVTRNFDVFFDLRLNKRLRKQSWGWWFVTLSRPLWRHFNVLCFIITLPTAFMECIRFIYFVEITGIGRGLWLDNVPVKDICKIVRYQSQENKVK